MEEVKLRKISKYIATYFNTDIKDVFWNDFFGDDNFYITIGNNTDKQLKEYSK